MASSASMSLPLSLLTTLLLLLSLLHPAAGLAAPVRAVGTKPGAGGVVERRKLTFGEEMIAGATARAAAQWVMFPADALKTLRQTRGAVEGLAKLPPVSKLLKGASTTSAMALPAGAIQFSVFPWAKTALRSVAPAGMGVTVVELAASAFASICASVVQGPQELLKQRMQTGIYPTFRGGVSSVWKEGGLLGFYQGLGPTMARNTPMVCLTFTAFARLKDAYKEKFGEPPSGTWSFLLGGCAASVACVLTQPIDVVKTRLLTQAASKLTPYTGVGDCVTRMLKEEGAASFFRGLAPRVLYVAPFAAVQFAVHEAVSALIHALDRR